MEQRGRPKDPGSSHALFFFFGGGGGVLGFAAAGEEAAVCQLEGHTRGEVLSFAKKGTWCLGRRQRAAPICVYIFSSI